uniref:Cytochrome c biogenesis protein CcsA n=1 Tax=Chlorella sorokiniana TaxID=3076 RepID=W8SIS1_CHLSO|nr:cytochrome c biogenesis protein CcsA [Chlorella sorokiniana]AHM23720.1 cytochrome c biogenesis protein CcsA [Chlorella sorokiniana]AII02090.1 cytochrome c heme attachment protein [Chlorella sorokiniana]
MDIAKIESFCINSCFISLFITTIYYWCKTLFIPNPTYSKSGLVGYGIAFIFLTSHLIFRWLDSGHFPLSNLYESLLFLAWCLVFLQIYLEIFLKTLFLGVFTSPALLCLIAFTDLSLPQELQKSEPLVPALQSNWLVMHVTVMIASYAALLLGCLLSIVYLIFLQVFKVETEKTTLFDNSQNNGAYPITKKSSNLNQISAFSENLSDSFPFSKNEVSPENKFFGQEASILVEKNKQIEAGTMAFFSEKVENTSFLTMLDNLSYRTIGIGFCFLTLGILSGAIWANETWGNYWSWDPKETWAFITWLTFATYLHSRLIAGWTGSKPAWIASFGFIIVWICYLGVNLIGKGLHSYGFFQL